MSRRKSAQANLELTSLIDVVFLLLIFFMISTTFAKVITKLDIKLPKARAVVVQEKLDEAIIEIASDKTIALNGKIMTIEELDKALAEMGKKDPDQIVVIKGDHLVNYGRVIEIMGICKDNNLEKLGMAALPVNEQ